MKNFVKTLYFVPFIVFVAAYLIMALLGFSVISITEVFWLIVFLVSGILLSNGKFWGGVFGLIPATAFMYMSTRNTGQVINIELPLGIAIAVYYIICSFIVYKLKYSNKKCNE